MKKSGSGWGVERRHQTEVPPGSGRSEDLKYGGISKEDVVDSQPDTGYLIPTVLPHVTEFSVVSQMEPKD